MGIESAKIAQQHSAVTPIFLKFIFASLLIRLSSLPWKERLLHPAGIPVAVHSARGPLHEEGERKARDCLVGILPAIRKLPDSEPVTSGLPTNRKLRNERCGNRLDKKAQPSLKRPLLIFKPLIFDSRVEGAILSCAAAPFGPATRPRLFARAAS